MTKESSLRVVAWNIEDRILDEAIQARIRHEDADVVLLVEGYSASESRERVADALNSLIEYRYWTINYNSTDKRKDEHGYIVLIKEQFDDTEVAPIQAPARQFVKVTVNGQSLTLVHLDDRSKTTRKKEVEYLLKRQPSLVVGDFNSDHHDSLVGKVLSSWVVSRVIDLLVKLRLEISPSDAKEDNAPKGLRRRVGRVVSLAHRLRDMTSPTNRVLDMFAVRGLEDAMPAGVVTRTLIGGLGVQLDHIVRDALKVSVTNVHTIPGAPSDHNGIVFTAQWK